MRNLPDSLLAMSVLISLGSSSGSGFLYRSELSMYLVTAKHVLFDDQSNIRTSEIEIICQSKDLNSSNVHRVRIDLEKLIPRYHQKADVAVVKIGRILEKEKVFRYNTENITFLEKGETNMITAKIEDVNILDEVMISNDVYVFGYPTSLGIETSLQFDMNKPLLRKGIVANIYKKQQTIILDCPVYGGNSGGPVIQVRKKGKSNQLKLIGVVSQYIPYVQRWRNERDKLVHLEYLNSGYSVATSMDLVIDLIAKIEKEEDEKKSKPSK